MSLPETAARQTLRDIQTLRNAADIDVIHGRWRAAIARLRRAQELLMDLHHDAGVLDPDGFAPLFGRGFTIDVLTHDDEMVELLALLRAHQRDEEARRKLESYIFDVKKLRAKYA